MRRISSKMTLFNKRVFPTIWFGFLAIMCVAGGLSTGALPFLLVPAAMALFGFFLMKHLVWDLADEVYDGGDFLVVRRRGQEETVALSNVMNVSASTAMNPPRITLTLAVPGRFGDEIAFSPAMEVTLNPFAKNRIAQDLIVRVDRARTRRGG